MQILMNKIQKRGLQKATEECLLSATALNQKTGKSGVNSPPLLPFWHFRLPLVFFVFYFTFVKIILVYAKPIVFTKIFLIDAYNLLVYTKYMRRWYNEHEVLQTFRFIDTQRDEKNRFIK